MRYLRGTTDCQGTAHWQGGDLNLRGYSDADWGGDLDESKFTSGYVFTLGEPYLGAARSKIALLYQLWKQSMLFVASPLRRQFG